jgi:uncharacterized protein YcbK (DUF882 family)
MKLTNNFDYGEFFVSDSFPEYAQLLKEKHANDLDMIERFTQLSSFCLQPFRDYVKAPFKITSGYRDEWLNTKVGGEGKSDHMYAMACDITFDNISRLEFEWAVVHLPYRQIIYYPEQHFIHISHNQKDKETQHRAFIKENGKYNPVMLKIV